MNLRDFRRLLRITVPAVTCAAASAAFDLPAEAQFPDVLSAEECPGCREPFELMGTWSTPLTSSDDSAWRLEDFFCVVACTRAARASAAAVLGNPANASRPWVELYTQVVAENARSAATVARASGGPGTTGAHGARRLEVAEPSFACDPRGFASQVISPLPLRIEQRAGEVVLRYEELGVERTAALEADGARSSVLASPNASAAFGRSTARFETGALVIETTDIPAGRLHAWFGGMPHSDELRATERYTPSEDGNWLELTLTLDDPETLRQPLVVMKRWRRVPGVQILHYACDVMSGQLENVFAEYVDPAKLDARRRRELQTFAPHGHTTCSVDVSKEESHDHTEAEEQDREAQPEMVGGRRAAQRRPRSRRGRLQVAQPGANRRIAQTLRRAQQATQGHATAVSDVDVELLHQPRRPSAFASS